MKEDAQVNGKQRGVSKVAQQPDVEVRRSAPRRKSGRECKQGLIAGTLGIGGSDRAGAASGARISAREPVWRTARAYFASDPRRFADLAASRCRELVHLSTFFYLWSLLLHLPTRPTIFFPSRFSKLLRRTLLSHSDSDSLLAYRDCTTKDPVANARKQSFRYRRHGFSSHRRR